MSIVFRRDWRYWLFVLTFSTLNDAMVRCSVDLSFPGLKNDGEEVTKQGYLWHY